MRGRWWRSEREKYTQGSRQILYGMVKWKSEGGGGGGVREKSIPRDQGGYWMEWGSGRVRGRRREAEK